MLRFSIKERGAKGKWRKLQSNELAGRTLREVLLSFAGQEVVAEFALDGEVYFLAGTEHWLERMKEKGSAVRFAEAIALIEKTAPELLGCEIPNC